MTRFAERFREEGMQQGEATVLMRLLHRRFGDLPQEQCRRIKTADAATLLNWADRVLTDEGLDEVCTESAGSGMARCAAKHAAPSPQ